VNHRLAANCTKIVSAFPLPRLGRRCRAMASGISLAVALSVASYPAAAYQFVTRDSAAATTTVVTTTAGCGSKHQIGEFNLSTTDGLGKTRSYLVQVPTDYNPSKAYSLNFVFHGAGANAWQANSWGLQNVAGALESGIFVFPNGIAFQNYGIGWDDTSKGYDIPFFDNMLKYMESAYCIDSARVFAAGFSWGGDFVTALACNRGNVLRAVAINSASDEFNDRTNYLTYQDLPCASTSHPTIRFEHAIGGDSEYPAPNFATTSKLLQSFSACSATCSSPTTNVPSSSSAMTCVSYNGCGHQYIECSFDASIGHALPPNWAADTWAFFQTFP
jgi:poly(3-hydroxybutyrate) depolymerase